MRLVRRQGEWSLGVVRAGEGHWVYMVGVVGVFSSAKLFNFDNIGYYPAQWAGE